MNTLAHERIAEALGRLTLSEKRALAAELRRMIAEEMSPSASADGTCPRCHRGGAVRKGHNPDGSQRWLCRACGRTFCATTLSVLGRSRLPEDTWLSYADGMADGLSLRALAGRCGVSLKTSWFMRMRICESMAARLDPFRSGPGVSAEVDGTMVHESLSGNGARGGFEMPRERHKGGKSLHLRGVSGQLACVVCGANDRGDSFCELAGRAHSTASAIRAVLEGRLAPGTEVATDDLSQYDAALSALGCGHEVRPSRPAAGEPALGMVNALHKRLADFMRPFNGVATRRLQRYLDWFCWLEQFRRGGADRRGLVGREALTGRYRSSVRDLFAEPRYDMGYWEARGWSPAA